MKNKKDQTLAAYSFILGILYILFGLFEALIFFAPSVKTLPLMNFEPDVIASFTLMVIGGIYIHGSITWRRGDKNAVAFPIVATIIACGIAILYSLILLAHLTEKFILGNPDYLDWSFIQDFKPEIYLAVLTVPILYWVYKAIKIGEIQPV